LIPASLFRKSTWIAFLLASMNAYFHKKQLMMTQ